MTAEEKASRIKQACGHRYQFMKDHMDENGWFPDSILGDAIWPLSVCSKTWKNGQLFWRMSSLSDLPE